MRKIKKFLYGSYYDWYFGQPETIMNPGKTIPISNIQGISLNLLIPIATLSLPKPQLSEKALEAILRHFKSSTLSNLSFFQSKTGQALTQAGIDAISSSLASKFSNEVLGDSELGRGLGTLFSSGISSAGNTISNNIIKGKALTEGLGKNAGASLAGAGAGLAANYIGLGINALGGDSMLSRGIGQGIATGLGTLGGTLASNLVSGTGSKLAFGGTGLFSDMSKMKGAINPYALGATVLGSALGASMGPSKEYAGKYGNITQTMDTAYDLATAGVNFIPGIGQGLSAAMVLNKGLSNIFGSTDGMCVCAGTKVYTASGEVINIEDLVQNLGIIGWNENTHEVRPNTIKGIVEPRQKECLEIELKNGIILRCSIDHPILSNNKPKAETHRINGKRIAYRDWEFRRADELKVGDFVGLANNIDYWGTEEMPNAYLVGMLIGDGTYTYESSCRLCSVDPSTWKYIEENNLGVINNCSGTDPNKYSTEYRTYRIINGMQLMKDLGIAYLSGTSKTFPKNLGKYNKDSICKMIAGLYDTDGSISVNEEKGTYKITFYLSNLNLLYDLRNLLHKLGIFSTIYTRKASVNKLANGKIINSNLSYRLEITDMYSANNFYKNIPLNIDYKREHLEKIHQILLNKKPLEHNEFSGAKLYKIISIKPIGILTVYNLEATEDHTYIANGIITHNTKTDAILGSAFMPAPVKWLNMWGSSKTGTFNNQSWLNSEKANSFMGDAFGNLNDRFDLARTEAGKTYGTFSQGAKRRAQENIDFANYAWNKILNMADLNEIQNIRSLAMSSINNLRYALMIQGGFKPLAIGKRGMKIFNNATNHNIGMRLLSAAALIDNKSMILSAQGGTKVTRPPRMRAHRKGDESRGLTPEEQEWWRLHEEEQKRLLEENTARKIKEKEEAADKFNQQVNTVMGAMTLQANETPFTGQEYQQAAENLRLEKVEKFHEAEKIGEASLMADLAVSAAPLLLRGFRWVFNKAGLLVKVPISKSDMKPFLDDYGREIIPTPWKGTDLELIDLILENQVNILRDYFSPLKKEQVMKAMNWGEKEYSELLDELMRSIGTLTEGEVKGPKDGFTIIAQHKGQAVGEGENMTGLHIMTFNRERIPDEKTAVEAIIHEIGGHGKTMSINPNKPNKISEAFPRITLLMLKNQELADNILELNGRGKFFSLFPKVSDLELYIYNNNIPKHKVENLFNQRRYFNYMTNDILERAARAYTGLLMDKLGFDKTLNIQQLERYYTPESVEKFKNAVLNYGVPVTIGGSTAATLYNTNK